jgi:predicted 3-demethylubiquinone-9 3-methyltransferase (glyoxalase superfamily)
MSKITPFLWFNDQAEEAVAFYAAIFKDSKVGSVSRYGEGGPAPAGRVMTVEFQLAGQDFIALNGGPYFTFTPAISFFVTCATQAEVDAYWEQLSEGGEKEQCGWLKDKYGVSWQIVPAALGEMLGDPDAERARRVTQAMLQMTKLDIAALRRAYEQE